MRCARARSFQTLLAPEATDAYKKHARRKGWNAGGSGGGRLGGGGGGGGGGVRARSRFGDMGTLKDNNHSASTRLRASPSATSSHML